MALTRKLLKGMGLTDEQVDTIIEAHADTVDGLKAERDKFKTDAEKLPSIEKELTDLKAKGDDGWKDKHDTVKKEYEDFKAGIEAGSDFVMISHMVNESITKTNMECSMSTNVMTNILRNTMGYTKIIITDSLSMGAITLHFSAGAAAVTALEAGADMLLMPANVEEAAAAIRGAMESGRISEMRLNESVARVLKVKLERGIL